jgi:hypothetical protein
MGYLDEALRDNSPIDPVALAEINAKLDAQTALITAQQSGLDALAAELGALDDAQTTVESVQNAAIAAAQAVNTAQAAAIAAADALNIAQSAAMVANDATDTGQASAIAALESTVGDHTATLAGYPAVASAVAANTAALGPLVAAALTTLHQNAVDLRRFAPGGVLTDANIDDAIDAAITAAMLLVGPGFRGPAPIIRCPAGIWTLSRPHVFPAWTGTSHNQCVIGFRGESMNETIFLVSSDVTGTPVFTFGTGSTADVNPWTMYLRVGGFSIIATTEDDCIRTGIRVYCAVNPIIFDVRVRGLTHANAKYDQGRGIEILPATGAGVEINSQFVAILNSDFTACMTGIYVRLSYPVLIDNTHSQASHFENCIFDGCMVEMRNGGVQFAGDLTAWPDRWYGRRNMPGVVTGFSRTAGLASGTGATCGAMVAGNVCLVTGLTGANLHTQIDRGRWLELTPAGASANELKVRGVYKIDSVVSATSCYVRKGSNHTSQGSLTWQVREAMAGSEMTFDNLYDEGHRVATYGFYRDNLGTGAYVIKRPMSISFDHVVEADGAYRVRVEAPIYANSPPKIARLRMVKEAHVDATMARIDTDDFSYPGLVCRSAWQRQLLGLIGSDQRQPVAMRDSGGGNAVRLLTAFEELGFVEWWYALRTASINIVGAEARSWTGLNKGSILTPTVGVLYPTYTPDDPLFGGPCITCVAGTHLTGRGFSGSIAAAHLPTTPYLCTIFTIARMESATPSGGSEMCRVQVSTADANQFVAFNDALWTSGVYGMNEGTGIGNSLTPLTPAMDVDPHAYVFGRHPDGANVISTDHGEDYRYHNAATALSASHTLGANLGVQIGGPTATYSHRGFRVVCVAVKAGPLSQAEHRKLIDLARNEHPLEA